MSAAHRPALRLLRAALAAACVALCAASAAQVPVARVNGVAILSDALDRGFDERLRARGTSITRLGNPAVAGELRRAALDDLISEELLWQKARRDGMVVGDAEVDASVAETMARFHTREAFRRRIARDGFDEPAYREHVRRRLSADRVAQALVEASVTVSDADIADFYRANAAHYTQPARMRLREILIRADARGNAAARAAARSRIDAIRARIVAGEAFADLARQLSDHPTRQWGGEHDPLAEGQLAPALERAAAALQPGEVSAPIETEAGWHLLKLEERIPALTRPLAEVADEIRQQLLQQRGRQALAREVAALRERSKVEVLWTR